MAQIVECTCNAADLGVGKVPWTRVWQFTPVFLPRESHGQRSLVGCSPWGHRELDTTEQLHFTSLQWKFNVKPLYWKLPKDFHIICTRNFFFKISSYAALKYLYLFEYLFIFCLFSPHHLPTYPPIEKNSYDSSSL